MQREDVVKWHPKKGLNCGCIDVLRDTPILYIKPKRKASQAYPHPTGEAHHSFEIIQKARNNPTMSIAILHGFKPPEPIPKACPARREVCIRELPNEEKRSL